MQEDPRIQDQSGEYSSLAHREFSSNEGPCLEEVAYFLEELRVQRKNKGLVV